MGAPPTHDTPVSTADSTEGVWLTDREPGELLGVRRVVVYLQDSDTIVVGEAPNRQEAAELAEKINAAIDRAIERADWVELGDRLVRPEAIASVDVELAE